MTEDLASVRRADARRLAVQTLVTAVAVLAGVTTLGALFRPEIEARATWLVARTGYAGMFGGAFLSDICMFPVPPQFYMFAATAAGAPVVPTLVATCTGSVVAAYLAYPLAGRLARLPWLRHRIDATRARIDPLFVRWGYWAVAIGAASPIPFSWLCYLAGLYRVPFRYYAMFVLFRVPRLLFFYALIRVGWGHR